MKDFPTWPHLENLDRILSEYDPTFLDRAPRDEKREWLVTEKVHGFNARFGVTDAGLPWVGSRNQVVHTGDYRTWPADGLQGFVGWAASVIEHVMVGETVFGEWAGKGIQKGIDYGERRFWMFGSMFDGGLDQWGIVEAFAWALGCSTVPVIYKSEIPPPLSHLDSERSRRSVIADETREGVVIMRWPPPNFGHGPLIAKFKSPAFAEVSRAPKAARELPDLEQAKALVERYATPQRMEHVLYQVKEQQSPSGVVGCNPLLPEYTGHVMREMHDDIVREAGSEYESMSDESKKAFGKVLNPTTKRLLDSARLTAAIAA